MVQIFREIYIFHIDISFAEDFQSSFILKVKGFPQIQFEIYKDDRLLLAS